MLFHRVCVVLQRLNQQLVFYPILWVFTILALGSLETLLAVLGCPSYIINHFMECNHSINYSITHVNHTSYQARQLCIECAHWINHWIIFVKHSSNQVGDGWYKQRYIECAHTKSITQSHMLIICKSSKTVMYRMSSQNQTLQGNGYYKKKNDLRWPYCLSIIGCNFVSNDLLHQTLISYNGPWFTFPFMHIWWQHNDVIRF